MALEVADIAAPATPASSDARALEKLAKVRAQELLPQLTLEEKIHLLGGLDFGRTSGAPRLGLPCLKTSDGPNGIRGGNVGLDVLLGFPFNLSNQPVIGSAFYPCTTALAASWSRETAELMGEGIGKDGWSKNVHLTLAPTINIVRDPRNGRGFECLSEDPLLTAEMASRWTSGCQDKSGVLVTLKHFVANECETDRHSSNVLCEPAALREVYMRPFELVIRDLRKRGKLSPASIMMAYNSLDGEPCSSNEFLLKQVLRREWNWQGAAMSDWFGTYKGVESLNRGLDLEMPGGPVHRRLDNVKKQLASGDLKEGTIDERATRMLEMIVLAKLVCKGSKLFTEDDLTQDIDARSPADAQRDAEIRRIGAEACVLLKNEEQVLPIDEKRVKKIVLIGEPAKHPLSAGGGSASMPAYKYVSALAAFREVLPDVAIEWHQGCKLSAHLGAPSTEQLGGKALSFTWHRYEVVTGAVEPKAFFTSKHEIPQLHGFLGGYQPDTDFVAIRGSFDLTPSTSGDHQISLECFGTCNVTVSDASGMLAEWKQKGEIDVPTFMFNPAKIREKHTLSMTAGQAATVKFEYRTPNAVSGHLPLRKQAFRFGFAEAVDSDAIIQEAVKAAAEADVAIVFTGTGPEYESEGNDRKDIVLPARQNDLVSAVAKGAPGRTVVVNASGTAVAMPWADEKGVASIVQAWFGGEESGNAIADVLLGKREPGGRMPMTFPKKIQDHPSFGNFPTSDHVDKEKHGRAPVEYKEGTLYGHRWFEDKKIEPLFWFGQGLSYTTFDTKIASQSGELTSDAASAVILKVAVSNTGSRSGKHLVQVYNVGTSTQAEPRRLVAFADVSDVPAGETKMVALDIDRQALARWQVGEAQWRAASGTHKFVIAYSSDPADTHTLPFEIEVKENITWL